MFLVNFLLTCSIILSQYSGWLRTGRSGLNSQWWQWFTGYISIRKRECGNITTLGMHRSFFYPLATWHRTWAWIWKDYKSSNIHTLEIKVWFYDTYLSSLCILDFSVFLNFMEAFLLFRAEVICRVLDWTKFDMAGHGISMRSMISSLQLEYLFKNMISQFKF